MMWPMIPVSELCVLAVDCVNKTAPTVEYETEFKMIRTTNVKSGFIDLEEVRYVTEAVFQKWTRRSRPKYGDVILTREAPVGEVGRFTSDDDKVLLGQRLFHYRPDPKQLDWNFLAYVLQSPQVQGRFKGMGFGVTVDHVRVGDAERLPIPCPPLAIQKKIGDILSAYDDMIENNRRRIQLLEESARQLYKEWFVRLRFPGHEHVKIVDGVPEGWEMFLISEVCETVGGGTPSTKIAENWNGEIEWIVPTDITKNDCLFLLESERRISDKGLRESSAKIVPPWTILMTSRASVGYFGLSDKEVCTNQGFISIIPFNDDFRMYLLFNLMDRVNEIRANAKGTTYPEISKGQFRNMSVVLPPKLLAIQFGTVVFSVIQQIRCLKKATQRLESARDRLLPRLMNREIAV
jgi:type I restriction enzyme S subunit